MSTQNKDHTIFIRANKNNGHFTQVSNQIINNAQLSFADKGLLLYLLSKPDTWKIARKDLEKHASDGQTKIRAILKHLRVLGYLTLTKIVDTNGRILGWRYTVYEQPIENPIETYITLCKGQNKSKQNTQKVPTPKTKKGAHTDGVYPDVDFPHVGKPPHSNINKSNTNNLSIYKKKDRKTVPYTEPTKQATTTHIENLKEQLEYKTIIQRDAYKEWLDAWITLIADQLASTQALYINGAYISANQFKQRMALLTPEHLLHCQQNIQAINHPIKNMRAYILASLYNCPNTYTAQLSNSVNTRFAQASGAMAQAIYTPLY